MKASKQFSIVLAAAVLAFGAVTVAPQQADASYRSEERRVGKEC